MRGLKLDHVCKSGHRCGSRNIPWEPDEYYLASPDHQQQWYRIWRIKGISCSLRKQHLNDDKFSTNIYIYVYIYIHIYILWKQFDTQRFSILHDAAFIVCYSLGHTFVGYAVCHILWLIWQWYLSGYIMNGVCDKASMSWTRYSIGELWFKGLQAEKIHD